ncbi:MAG: hypothetical protein ACJ75H_01755 [Thermoanaerobaculia bacterium]
MARPAKPAKKPVKKAASAQKAKPAQKPRPAKKAPTKAALKAAGLTPANYFELVRGGTTITFTESNIAGQPLLNFDDGARQLSFMGNQIEQLSSEIGAILTVDLDFIPDLRTDALTVVIPQVNLKGGAPARFKTVVIFTAIRSSIAGPGLVEGPIQTYTAQTFRGTASFIVS